MRDRFALFFFKLISRLPLTWGRAVGAVAGSLMWLVNGREARTTMTNLALCFPHMSKAERCAFARKSLRETAKTAAEAGAIWHHSWPWLQQHILEVKGEELLRERLAEGRGLLVLAPHHGNWEVVAPYLASIAPLTAMYQPLKNPCVDAMVLKGRSKVDTTMAPTNRRGVMMLFKALQNGTIVGVLPDQVPERDASSGLAPFFGQPALTIGLIHGLIQRTGCAVVSVFAERIAGGFRMRVLDVDEAIYAADETTSLTGLNASVERCVKFSPEQYQWEYKRFRRLPDTHPKHY